MAEYNEILIKEDAHKIELLCQDLPELQKLIKSKFEIEKAN